MVIRGGRYDDGTSTATGRAGVAAILTLPIRTDLVALRNEAGTLQCTDAEMLGDHFVCEAKIRHGRPQH